MLIFNQPVSFGDFKVYVSSNSELKHYLIKNFVKREYGFKMCTVKM